MKKLISINSHLIKQIVQFLPKHVQAIPEMQAFIAAIDKSYNHYNKEIDLLERAFKLSENEFIAVNETLSQEVAIKQNSIRSLKDSLTTIGIKDFTSKDDDLLVISQYLSDEIGKRKNGELLFASMINKSMNGIMMADKNGDVLFCNHLFIEVFGNIVRDNHVFDASIDFNKESVHNSLIDPFYFPVLKNVFIGKKKQIEEKIKLTDGRILEWDYIPIYIADEYTGYYFEWRDITEKLTIQQELQQQRKFTQDILNNLPADIAVFDPNHTYLFVNPQGIKNEEIRNWLVGKNDYDYCLFRNLDTANADKRRSYFNKAVAEKKTVGWIDEHKVDEHSSRFVLRNFYPFFENEKLKYVFGYGVDITDIKKAEIKMMEALEEKNSILESIGEGYFATDKNWVVTYWNQHLEKIFRIEKKDVIGKSIIEILPGIQDTSFFKLLQKVSQSNVSENLELYYQKFCVWLEIKIYPSSRGLTIYLKDITTRKADENQIRQFNQDLRKQAAELANSNTELEQFAYVISHDLQEPLRMVSSFLSQLEKRIGESLDERSKQYIFYAVDGAKKMRRMILDLLEYSRVNSKTEDLPEEIDLSQLVIEVEELLTEQIKEKKAVIKTENLCSIINFRSPMRQVFQNLIGNALKYSKPNGEVFIAITSVESDSTVQITVSDNGIGIHPDYFEKIFVIFQRLHQKESYSGTGIGLSITKKIIENMGGTIWVESTEGIGSRFIFVIPKKVKYE